jgi:hypothetical protein
MTKFSLPLAAMTMLMARPSSPFSPSNNIGFLAKQPGAGGGAITSTGSTLLGREFVSTSSSSLHIASTDIITTVQTTGKIPNEDDQLAQLAYEFQAERNRPFFTIQEIHKKDNLIAENLKEELREDFNVPSTWSDAIQTYIQSPTMQFAFSALGATLLMRLGASVPFQLSDVSAVVGVSVFWYVQEWIVHHSGFHGNDDGTASHPFEYHDRHHIIPFFHVAIDPINLFISWFAAASGIALLSTKVLAESSVPLHLALDGLAAYTFCGVAYETLHYLAHTKVPLQGFLQDMRRHHVLHHMSPEENLSMLPLVDRIMGSEHVAEAKEE